MSTPSFIRLARACLGAFLLACAGAGTGVAAQGGEPPPLTRTDQDFVARATGDNAFQIALARRVLGKPPSEAARALAQHVLDDHTRMNIELAQLATHRHTQGASPPLPVQPTRDIDQHLADLQGAALEQAFAGLMIRDHRGAMPIYEKEAREGSDDRLRAFARQSIPILQRHMAMAQALTQAAGGPWAAPHAGGNEPHPKP
jgi:putative membrane protein